MCAPWWRPGCWSGSGAPIVWRKPLDTLQVPATVQALLAARIDRLPPEEKRLLQTAAVIGTEVPWPLLQAIADTPDEALYRSLAQLQAAEFLYETSLFPEPDYTFKHALTHEVAYGSLLQERRRALHARIVEALRPWPGTGWTTRWNGWRTMPCAARCGTRPWPMAARRGTRPWRARPTARRWRTASRRSRPSRISPETRDTREQAIDLRLSLRSALTALGEALGRRLDHLRRAETLAQTLGDPLRLGSVYATMSVNCWVTGEVRPRHRLRPARPGAGRHARAYRPPGPGASQPGSGLLRYGRLSSGRRESGAECRDAPGMICSLHALAPLTYVAASSRAWLGSCHAELGAFTEGLAMAEEGLRIAETVKSPFSLIEACHGISMVYLRQGDVQRAIPVLERAMGLCQDWHIPLLLPLQARSPGPGVYPGGAVAEGLALVEQGVEQAAARGRSRLLALLVAWLSEASLLAGRLEEAHQRAAQALELARQYQQRGTQAWALWLLGESTARQAIPQRSSPPQATTSQALALAEELGMRPLQAHCHRGLGTLYAATGQREQARAELSTAIEMYQAMEMTFWLPETEAALAQVEGRLMDFTALRTQVIALLRQRGRLPIGRSSASSRSMMRTWRPSRMNSSIAKPLAVDEEGAVLVWTGETGTTPPTAAASIGPPSAGAARLHPPISGRENPHLPQCPGRRTQAGHGAVCRPEGLHGVARRPRPGRGAQLLDPVLERMMAAVHRYEGPSTRSWAMASWPCLGTPGP